MEIRQRRTPRPDLSQSLRRARERAGLTLRSVAAAAGITAAYLSNLEGGRRCPSRTVAERLADALPLNDVERAAVLGGAVDDAGRDHPSRRQQQR